MKHHKSQTKPGSNGDRGEINPRPEAIALRAYELYQGRGRNAGHDMDDWLQAEHELAKPAKVATISGI